MKTDIIKAIQTYLDRDKAQYAIMINGSWGIGKTHFIQNEVIPAAGSIEFVYLSLYGLNSLEKLESLLQTKLAEISSRSQQSDKVQSLSRASALSAKSKPVLVQGSFDSSELSVRNQVLCFDDLERWSGDLDQCLSYINQLVEQENYKCLVIGNIDEISKTGMQAFANAREKTIRHVYQFENSYQSIFEVALGLPNYSSKASERFLRSLVRDNRVTLQRLLDRVSVRNIRTVSEAFQLYEYVLRRNSALFRGNRNLAFAYLMALQSALILVNRYLLDRDHRDQLMKQDHDEGKGFKYLSEIGYFDGKASGFLTEQARFLLDTIFYRMDQISLKGLFSIVRNGFYVKSDFVGNFDNWRKEQQYDTYLDKEKFYQLEDAAALKVFNEMYASLVKRQEVKNPITILLLAERIIEDMAAGVVEMNPVHFKSDIINTVDHLYESGQMQSIEVSIFDMSGDRFVNCRGIYNHVLKRSKTYQRFIEEQRVEGFWQQLSQKSPDLENLVAQYDAAEVFLYCSRIGEIQALFESLSNEQLFYLVNWLDDSLDSLSDSRKIQAGTRKELVKLVKKISARYENEIGVRSTQFRRLSRRLKSAFLGDMFEAD